MSFPRVCGDVPALIGKTTHTHWFSPRVRGCSEIVLRFGDAAWVFPACAGMFPGTPPSGCLMAPFSPRVRGCSSRSPLTSMANAVFPACAGMFRRLGVEFDRANRFPHVCGDVPTSQCSPMKTIMFSPRVRGCSFCGTIITKNCCVFPACAGMFLFYHQNRF